MNQTIVALATPFGRSGIGVIRLSGSNSLEITRYLTLDDKFNPQPRTTILKKIYDIETKQLIDQTLITYFQAPHSFTGEDVIEISCHGSPVLLRQIIDFCLKLDARLAEPGEFSLRALSNGQLNLSQAEAIRDLIDARTISSARQAIRQLRGELSNRLQSLKDDLLDIIVIFESSLEFVEDDLPDIHLISIRQKLNRIIFELEKLISTFKAGKLLREGIKVVIAGRANVGKSSIFNSLIGVDRAIVTDIAGTTRDSLFENLNIKGVPVSLVDTAGIRETSDIVESIGVDRTKRILSDADLVVVVLDSSVPFSSEDRQIFETVKELNYVVATNKIDLNTFCCILPEAYSHIKPIEVSAKDGLGLDTLQEAILEPFLPNDFNDSNFLISDARHYDLLNRAKQQIENSQSLIGNKSEEIILIGFHNAVRLFGEITGETSTEDMLTRIFSTFCIGK